MLSKRIVPFPSVLVAALLATSSALAQSTATLQGTVTDAKGAVLPNATVVVKNRSTSAERTTQTDSDGNYQLAALPLGVYSVEVRVQGFKTQVADQVTLEVAKTGSAKFSTGRRRHLRTGAGLFRRSRHRNRDHFRWHRHQPANRAGNSAQRPSLR